MIILPAIDILGGKCVRLYKGRYDAVTKYFDDPIKVAENFQKKGARFLHVIDLDGAKAGKAVNQNMILKLTSKVKIPVEVGGGIRNFEDADTYLRNGVARIILGTSALTDLNLLKKLIKKFGSEKIIVSLDFKNGQLATDGWLKQAKNSETIQDLKKIGIKTVVVTDISRDGTLTGPNFNLLKKVQQEGFQVIAAGGIKDQKDIENLRKQNLFGAIVGKAIYEGKINLISTSLAKRIIPCMDVTNGRVVKGTKFKELKDAGDAVELGKIYSKQGADELVFLDITATVEKRKTLIELVKNVAKNINIPFTVGGGIKNIADIKALLNAGADKISLGTVAVTNPKIVKDAAKRFGNQCIVISLDCKKERNTWKLFIKGGREKTQTDAITFAKKMENLGAGELLVNSLDRDGTKKGYDLELLQKISDAVNIPVIASSGAGKKEDFLKAFQQTNIDAALAASLFHYKELGIKELKKYLENNLINIRP